MNTGRNVDGFKKVIIQMEKSICLKRYISKLSEE
jgi:hypothetical protein